MDTFKELLGADNKKEQMARIKELLAKEANPEIMLQIRYDRIVDDIQVDMYGGDVPFDALYRMLELANTAIRRKELATVMAAAQETPPPPEE